MWGGFDAVLNSNEGTISNYLIQNPRWEDGEAFRVNDLGWLGENEAGQPRPATTKKRPACCKWWVVIGIGGTHAFAVETNEYQEHSLWNQRWVDLEHTAICQCPNDGPCDVDGEEWHGEDQYSEVVSRHLDFANAALGEPIGKAWVSLPDVGKRRSGDLTHRG